MKRYTVVFTPEAEEQLAELYHHIAEKTSAATALRYTPWGHNRMDEEAGQGKYLCISTHCA
jgi:hypothetical protein